MGLALFFGAFLLGPAELLSGSDSGSAFGRITRLLRTARGLGAAKPLLRGLRDTLTDGCSRNKITGFC